MDEVHPDWVLPQQTEARQERPSHRRLCGHLQARGLGPGQTPQASGPRLTVSPVAFPNPGSGCSLLAALGACRLVPVGSARNCDEGRGM